MGRIYLDHAATTPVRPEAVAAMIPLLGGGYNPSSLHAEGRAARAVLDGARQTVARVLGASPREIVFTGSGSEADVLAIVGAARARAERGRHVVTSAVEHHAVLHAFDLLEHDGWRVTRLGVDQRGLINPEALAAALTPETTLASVMLANNELGVVEPVPELARIACSRGVLFHTDAIQAAGWLPLDVAALGVDLLSISGHKFHGPKGVGALYVRRGTPLAPLIVGGGFATALGLAEAERPQTAPRVAALRDRLEAGIFAAIPDALVNGAGAPRLPGILSVAFADTPSDALLIRLDLEGIAASAGSACAAGSLEPSHVAAAIGLDERHRRGVVRFSLGRATTESEIDDVVCRLPALVVAVRAPLSV
jgi:cysteine desulfurase